MERRQMIAVLQDGCAVNRPLGFSDIFAWLSSNIGHPDRKKSLAIRLLADSAKEPFLMIAIFTGQKGPAGSGRKSGGAFGCQES
jgi:hypothetical protein